MTEPVFLLDTNICIYVLRDADGPAAQKLGECRQGSAAVSAISVAEIVRGLRREDADAWRKLEAMLTVITVLPFDQAAAEAYARIPFRRGTFDRLIAAQALALGLVVVTNNERDFADVPGLKVENWTMS